MRPSFGLHSMADSTKLGGEAGKPDGCAAIWRDLDRLENWAGRNFVIFRKFEMQVHEMQHSSGEQQTWIICWFV